jgi:hypothetical protein
MGNFLSKKGKQFNFTTEWELFEIKRIINIATEQSGNCTISKGKANVYRIE